MATLRLEPTIGWSAFVAWAVNGALLTVSFISAVGLFVLPLAALLAWMLSRYSPQHRDATGLLAGAGGLALFLGVVNLGHRPCPESGTVTILTEAGSSSCGGWDPIPFFIAGSVIIVAAVGAYLVLGNLATARTRRSDGSAA